MICANCRQDDCPSPTARHTYEPCGNGYQVTTTASGTVAPDPESSAVSAKDWIDMLDIAMARADKAEAEVKRLKATIAKAREHLHPGIQLSNPSYQEGYRYAAAQVLAILGES